MKLHEALDHVFTKFNTSELFYGHGIDSAWDEAVALVLKALDLPVDSGDEVLNNPVSSSQWKKIEQWMGMRIEQRIPIAYLTQQAWFMGLPFYVDERVLIPRSPFAEWIGYAFEPWVHKENVRRILEIGTGSGCIAIAAAIVFDKALVDAVDISEDALLVAERNVNDHNMTSRVHLVQSDCFSALTPLHQYDLILSNPPYVAQEEIDLLPEEYHHEPLQKALYADNEGMAIVDTILEKAASYLTENGVLVVEVGYSDDILMRHYPNLPFTWLDCELGGQGLFLLTREQLDAYKLSALR